MGRYPRAARGAAVKCIGCNAPAVETVDGDYVCVDCGSSVVSVSLQSRGIGDARPMEPADD